MTWDNIRPVSDTRLARSVIAFGRMVDEALGIPTLTAAVNYPLTSSDYPSRTFKQAEYSLVRAIKQFQRGLLTGGEFAEIVARCKATLALRPSSV